DRAQLEGSVPRTVEPCRRRKDARRAPLGGALRSRRRRGPDLRGADPRLRPFARRALGSSGPTVTARRGDRERADLGPATCRELLVVAFVPVLRADRAHAVGLVRIILAGQRRPRDLWNAAVGTVQGRG